MPAVHRLARPNAVIRAALLLAASPGVVAVQGQDPTGAGKHPAGLTFPACYDPSVGSLYLIKRPGLAERCLKPSHIEIVLRGVSPDGPRADAAPDGPAGGDLGGTYPNPLVVGLQGKPMSPAAPVGGQVLYFTTASGDR